MDQLMRALRHLQNSRLPYTRSYREVYTLGALETRTVTSQYYWDGLKRGGDPDHPYIVFQYTLDGCGCYAERNERYRVPPQAAFTAVVPSDHRYYRAPEASGWTFFWLIIRHPYVVRRMARRQATIGPVLTIHPDHVLLARALQLFEGICHGTFRDVFDEEQALFAFLLEYERFAVALRHDQPEHERLLNEVRAYVLRALNRPVSVAELAAAYQMSRSHFSHYFKSVTGLSPAHVVTRIRLEEAVRRLLHSKLKLEIIARETGFADANHLCKVFRRHFYLSPGEFRRQMRPLPDHSDPSLLTPQAASRSGLVRNDGKRLRRAGEPSPAPES